MIYVTFCIELKIDKRGFHPVFLFNFSILNKGRIIDDQTFFCLLCLKFASQENNGITTVLYYLDIGRKLINDTAV